MWVEPDNGAGRYERCGTNPMQPRRPHSEGMNGSQRKPHSVCLRMSPGGLAVPPAGQTATVLLSVTPAYCERTVQIARVVFFTRQGKGYPGQKRHNVIVGIRNTK